MATILRDLISDASSEEGFLLDTSYEINRWPYLLAMPIMWILTLWVIGKKFLLNFLNRQPEINTFWFDGLSSRCRKIKEGAASWQALNCIYNHSFGEEGKITDFWLGMMNAQAVRNRKRLVVSMLVEELRRRASEGRVPRLLSLASGSAQSVIEALSLLKREGIQVHVVLVDIDPAALTHSKELAHRHGVEDQIVILQEDIRGLLHIQRTLNEELPFDVVEMVGFLEYVKDKTIAKLLESVHALLATDGILLTCSIGNNPERWFLHWVINWKMIYRNSKALSRLLQKSKFRATIVSEPLSIHHVAICRKL